MAPRRPLPDLDLISVFKMLTPNEQLVASKMSPRCAILVRAANRRVKTLVITNRNVINGVILSNLKYTIDSFSLASESIMQELMDISDETFPDYPMTTHLSKWNCLMINSHQIRLIDTDTIEQVTNIFSAVTVLKFMVVKHSKHIETLVSLLQHPNWKCQLTNLMVDGTDLIDRALAGKLITAINGLTALKLLALDLEKYIEVPDLPILAQLKTMVFKSDRLSAFLRSLERNATDNADLEVHLLSNDTNALLTLSQPLHSRIVCYKFYAFDYTADQVSLLCRQFRSLTSLKIKSIESTKVGQLFSDLSLLHQLIHLKFEVDFSKVKEELPSSAFPLVQLNSVRALELVLRITSHSQIEWLNLLQMMPNLKTIYIFKFNCDSCKVRFSCYSRNSFLFSSSPSTTVCLGASLFKLHPRVDLKRIILVSSNERISAEKLLLQSQ
ncbi:hypothetical protein TYRP_007734 [Tyrophagus putrescentiae]|nr:hypothetical protein TYRP_007734 [Tyrophagus putrescentiae]